MTFLVLFPRLSGLICTRFMQILLLGRLGMYFMNGLGLMLDHYEARPKPGPSPVHRYQRIVIANDFDRSFNV